MHVVCLQDVDGVLLLADPAQPEQERQLEQLYLRFAQPNSLTMKQCLVLGLSVARGSEAAAAGWAGGWGYIRVARVVQSGDRSNR
jgi:hypothetical protein